MKALTLLVAIQTAVIIFLGVKIYSFEDVINTNKENKIDRKVIVKTKPKNSSENSSSSVELSLEDIRYVVREEFETILLENQSTDYSDSNAKVLTKSVPSDVERIEQINEQLDYFVSDGEFSQSELIEFENELGKLNYDDRKKALQKMSQLMSKSNISITP